MTTSMAASLFISNTLSMPTSSDTASYSLKVICYANPVVAYTIGYPNSSVALMLLPSSSSKVIRFPNSLVALMLLPTSSLKVICCPNSLVAFMLCWPNPTVASTMVIRWPTYCWPYPVGASTQYDQIKVRAPVQEVELGKKETVEEEVEIKE